MTDSIDLAPDLIKMRCVPFSILLKTEHRVLASRAIECDHKEVESRCVPVLHPLSRDFFGLNVDFSRFGL